MGLLTVTVAFPFVSGLVIGFAGTFLGTQRRRGWLLVGLGILFCYLLLEPFPPFPPASSKQKIFYLIILSILFANFASKQSGWMFRVLATLLLFASMGFIAGTKLLLTTSLPIQIWLGVLPLALGLGLMTPAVASRSEDQSAYALIGTEFAAIATSIVCLIGGYVGVAQLTGALSACLGGWLLFSYGGLLRNRSWSPLVMDERSVVVTQLVLSVFILNAAVFAPVAIPGSISLLLVSLYLGTFLKLPNSLDQRLRPVLLGAICATCAVASVATGYWLVMA